MPHPANTVPDYVRMSRHEWDLDDDGHEVIEHAVTVETDTTLRLAPNGTGGVEFVAGSGSGLNWEVMVSGTGLVMIDGLGNLMRHEVAY